ncbi:hypothetical protein FHR32_007327 [Streptosporangium album]|uniref:Uncharacterized protein n=1 Tax=Streptosporangium album TaxID=47479 RepID=A0A7W7WCS2_9ACTN|nr:hypothetical protein [Streptosporangium album]
MSDPHPALDELGDDRDVRLSVEDQSEAAAYELLVVGDHDADGHEAAPGSRIESKAASARLGSGRTAKGPASACTIIKLIAWPGMSCMSRAIAARSRSAARRVSLSFS